MPLRLVYLVRPLKQATSGSDMPGPNLNLQPPAVRPTIVSEIEDEEVTGHTNNRTKANVAGVRYTECFAT